MQAAMVMARLFRQLGIGALAGLGAGFVAGGLGARLAMKAVALIAGAAARGAITKNGNRIGAFTTDTVSLLVFGTFFGLFGGLLYVAVRPWLPRAGWARGAAFGALLLATCGVAVIEEENFDFHRFGIPLINLGLFAALFLLFGLLVAPLADRVDRAFPTLPPQRAVRPGMLAAYAVLAVAGLLGLLPIGLAVGSGLLGQGENSPAFRVVLLLFLYLLVAALAARLVLARGWGRRSGSGWRPGWARPDRAPDRPRPADRHRVGAARAGHRRPPACGGVITQAGECPLAPDEGRRGRVHGHRHLPR